MKKCHTEIWTMTQVTRNLDMILALNPLRIITRVPSGNMVDIWGLRITEDTIQDSVTDTNFIEAGVTTMTVTITMTEDIMMINTGPDLLLTILKVDHLVNQRTRTF